jgi:hypothetical protein
MQHYAMKAYGGVDVEIHDFLTSALVGGERSAWRPDRFTPRYPLDRKLGGPQNWSERRGENSRPYWDSNSDPSVVQPATRLTRR